MAIFHFSNFRQFASILYLEKFINLTFLIHLIYSVYTKNQRETSKRIYFEICEKKSFRKNIRV